MTLNISVAGKDFVVAGSDSRGIFGDVRIATATIDVMKKLHVVAPHVIVQVAGVAELGDNLVEEFIVQQQTRKVDGVRNVLNELRSFVVQKWDSYFANVPFQNRPPLILSVVGLGEKEGKYVSPHIFSLMSQFGFAPSVHNYGFSCMGVPLFANYILNRRYKNTLTLKQLTWLVAYAISETASQDHRVGKPINIAQVLPDGVSLLKSEDVETTLKSKGVI